MRTKIVVAATAALLAGGTTTVFAQPGYSGYESHSGDQGQSHQVPNFNQAASQFHGQSRFDQRRQLRQQLRQAGFQNINIVDTAYLVQARTPDGRSVVMVVDPPQAAALGASGVTSQQNQFSNVNSSRSNEVDRPQQFGVHQNEGVTVDLRELSARMADPGLMEPGQVHSYLQSRGFSEISNLNRNGNIYSGTANWFGEQVNLRVDGRNGFVIEPSHLTPGQVRIMLTSQGWDSINSIGLRGTSYRVQASRNGTPYALWIDARTGEINQQTASNTEGSSIRQ